MGRRERSGLHSAMNIMSSLLLCLAVGRLLFVIRSSQRTSALKRAQEDHHQVPKWLPTPKQIERQTPLPRHPRYENGQGKGAVVPVGVQRPKLRQGNGETGVLEHELPFVGGSYREDDRDGAWGVGLRVLIFTMDSMQDRVALAAKGGPAGEIKIRESLSKSLVEAGVEVEVAVSDLDFERRAGAMDIYGAYLLDPWTWAGKGWRIKAQLKGRQHKIFILDFFGSDKPHPNLGVPSIQHLTAFPVPASQARTFLGYRVDPREMMPSEGVLKKRQGVIWGKTSASLKGKSVENLILRLADYVELHSTVSPKDAKVRHKNIVYHGVLSQQEWHRLLQESKFMIGLGDPLSGPSAVDAVVAGCAYLNPVYSTPVKKIYNSQHPFMAQSVGEPYVCSFRQQDTNAAIECALKALQQDLEPMIPRDLSKEAHDKRVRDIFEPLLESQQVE